MQQPCSIAPQTAWQVLRLSTAFISLLLLFVSGPLSAQEAAPTARGANPRPAPGNPQAQDGKAQTARSSSGSRIDQSQLVGLPLNGRSYTQLATLEAGVSDPSAASGPRGVGGGGLNVAGGRSSSNVYLLDGTNVMDTENRAPQSAAGVQLGSDAVLQVLVFSTTYSAEYGRGSGGILNSITRSGTPEFHGEFFEYFRNSKSDARDFFDEEKVPFKRNQFGFTLTGPVRKERTYFLGSFEAMRDRLTTTELDDNPDLIARQGFPDANGKPTVTIAERVKPYLDLYPVPNLQPIGKGGIGRNSTPFFSPTDEDFFTVRVDHQISGRDSLFVRYTFDDATSNSPTQSALWGALHESRQQFLTLVGTHIFSPRLLNSFRLGYTRPVVTRESVSFIDIPRERFFVPDAPQFGQILIPGVTPFGPNPTTPERNVMNSFQFADDVIVQKGPHELKFGIGIHRYRWDVFSNSRRGAVWTFNSLRDFLQAGSEKTNDLVVALPGSSNDKAFRQTLIGLYLQDGYRFSPRLFVDLGLRYELSTLIHDKQGRTTFLPDPLRDSTAKVGPLLEKNPSLWNFSPRLGITWSPRDNQSTVLNAGFGIFYDHIYEYIVDQPKSSAPFYNRVFRIGFRAADFFPNAAAAAAGVPAEVIVLDYRHMHSPTVLRYNFALQQELPGGVRLQASYVGARGNHLYRSLEANLYPLPDLKDGTLYFRPNTLPLNPSFESVSITSSDAQSFYNSLQISANKRLGEGLSLQASYAYSKSVDDASSHSGSPQYGWTRTMERGLSDFDLRHRLTISSFYALPFGRGQTWLQSGFLSHTFGGWRLGSIIRYRTGTPFTPSLNVRTPGYRFTPTRPDLRPGYTNNPIKGTTAGCGGIVEAGQKLGTPELYFDPCAYEAPAPGTPGNVGRNTLIAPSAFSLDVSLQRDFRLATKWRLQFRAEFFNLPNHPSFRAPAAGRLVVFSGPLPTPRLNSTAGHIASTATTARQIQFALRLFF